MCVDELGGEKSCLSFETIFVVAEIGCEGLTASLMSCRVGCVRVRVYNRFSILYMMVSSRACLCIWISMLI